MCAKSADMCTKMTHCQMILSVQFASMVLMILKKFNNKKAWQNAKLFYSF
jgi:hypothetical protein